MTRTSYTLEFKDKLVKEVLETRNLSLVARNHEIAPTTLKQWVDNYKRYGAVSKKDQAPEALVKEQKLSTSDPTLNKENETLKKLLGEKDLEIAILKDLLKKTNPHLLKRLK